MNLSVNSINFNSKTRRTFSSNVNFKARLENREILVNWFKNSFDEDHINNCLDSIKFNYLDTDTVTIAGISKKQAGSSFKSSVETLDYLDYTFKDENGNITQLETPLIDEKDGVKTLLDPAYVAFAILDSIDKVRKE